MLSNKCFLFCAIHLPDFLHSTKRMEPNNKSLLLLLEMSYQAYIHHCLFHSVSRMFFKLNKSKNFTPGFIMVLHTFGRDLKWNPHIHCLISEGGYNDDGFWLNVKYFNYTYLRNAFRTALLNELKSCLGSSFKKVKSKRYQVYRSSCYCHFQN